MSRASILARVHASLGADAGDLGRREAAAGRLAEPPCHLIPARASRPAPELLVLFQEALSAQGADIVTVGTAQEIPAAVACYLASHDLPLRVRAGADPYLAGLPWTAAPGLALLAGPAAAGDSAGLSRAVAGVAETGTLLLASGPDNPVTLAFVPETHLVVVAQETIVGSYEAGMKRLGTAPGHLPRALNLISGPSRTGDIGGKIVMGAHGPRRLAVLVVESRAP